MDFLVKHVCFRDHPHDHDEARVLWAAVGVEAAMLDQIVRVHPIWTGSHLLVAKDLEGQLGFLDEVSTVLLYLWRWRRFTESRFGSLGTASRALVASLLAGLEPLVALTREDPHCSNYHLNGFQKIGPAAVEAALVIALSSWVSETYLHMFMDDDRLALRAAEVWDSCVEEVEYLLGLPAQIWDYLVQLLPAEASSSTALRSATVTSALISLCFLHSQVFASLESLPWCLTQGDPEEQLDRLSALDKDSLQDSCSVQLRALIDLGSGREELCRALRLMSQASWTTMGVEQQHGSCAALHKKHPGYGPCS